MRGHGFCGGCDICELHISVHQGEKLPLLLYKGKTPLQKQSSLQRSRGAVGMCLWEHIRAPV